MPDAEPMAGAAYDVEVSFVMPCLDEAETLAGCIEAAQRCIDANGALYFREEFPWSGRPGRGWAFCANI